MLKSRFLLLAGVSLLWIAPLKGQTNDQAKTAQGQSQTLPSPQGPSAARPADVASVDAIVAEVYAVISGPKGEKRDWDRFRSLFLPGAQLVHTGPNKEGGYDATSVSPSQYATRAESYFEKEGFFERESFRHMDRYGNIVQLFSTYESRHDSKDVKPFAKGINSFQLFFDGTRWWVVSIYWQQESPDMPVPKQYLPAAP
jgi:hypothetical protein